MTKEILVQHTLDAVGELLIWTDVAAEKEIDFNQWYDTEHMQERASIPGFKWSRRYHSASAARPYLALYQTESLHIFRSAPYRQAFENQTEWSIRNFAEMKNTQRRVNAVTQVFGAGTGAAVSLIRLGSVATAQQAIGLARELSAAIPGVIAQRLLTPDPDLSTPLPSENVETRVLEPYLVVEVTTLTAANLAGAWMSQRLGLSDTAHSSFNLLWDLQATDL